MAAPVKEKGWNHVFTAGPDIGRSSVNIDIPQFIEPVGATNFMAYDNTRRQILLTIKNILVGFGWTVKCSSNAVTYGTGDRWNTISDLIWYPNTGSPHSWIVLTNPAWGYDVLFDLYNQPSYTYTIIFKVAPNGNYAAGGGSLTAAPSDPSYTYTFLSGTWLTNTSNEFSAVVHGMQSTDNKTTRIAVYYWGGRVAVFMFEHILDPVVSWNLPVAFMAPLVGTRYNNILRSLNTQWLIPYPNSTGWLTAVTTVEATGNGLWNLAPMGLMDNYRAVPTDIGGWPFSAMGVCGVTAGYRGKIGRFADVWFGGDMISEGACYADATPYDYAHWGSFIVPWNGSSTCRVS